MPRWPLTARERFDARWVVDPGNGCWVWVGLRDRHGYGEFFYEGSHRRAHRVGWELYVGPIPEGLVVDHLCCNRPCVNPEHLEPVTFAENVRRATATHCRRGHEFTPENTYWTPSDGKRKCRECQRASWRARKARKLASGAAW